MTAADVAGAHVLKALQAGAASRKIQHIPSPLHIHPHRQVQSDTQIVDRGEMIHLAHLPLQLRGRPEAEIRPGDVPLHDPNAPHQRRVRGLERRRPLARKQCKLWLHQADCIVVRAGEDAGKQLGTEKAGEAGEKDCRHICSIYSV